MDKKISLAITTWNRCDLTVRSFINIIDNDKIDDIVIIDDFGKIAIYKQLEKKLKELNNPKIKLHRNMKNLGMAENKNKAISLSKNEWVILFDSDNIINTSYIDTIYSLQDWDYDAIYMPDFANETFDYTKFSGEQVTKQNIKKYLKIDIFSGALNTCNYFVNRDMYLSTYEYNPKIKGTDTMFFAYLWLRRNNYLYFVPGLNYIHSIHENCGYLDNGIYNGTMAEKLRKKLNNL